mmetsp:Transcript_25501/g.43001  ORF Transcript_25501/g.43001 Transcript_25501/m.43001 type:complete len:539 (-) Transcript_25501:452-2068(-)
MQRRAFHRQSSKDDMAIKKSLNTPTSIEAPVKNSSGTAAVLLKKPAACDINLDFRSRRAELLKVQFIEVYLGLQDFLAADIHVIVAIYLQAADRLYEIVLVDKELMKEMVRFYILEDEIDDQMHRRYESLMKIYRSRPPLSVSMALPHHSMNALPPISPINTMSISSNDDNCSAGKQPSPEKNGTSSLNKPQSLFTKRPKSRGDETQRRDRGGKHPAASPKASGSSSRPKLHKIPSFQSDVVYDAASRNTLVSGVIRTGSGLKLLSKMTKEDMLKKKDRLQESDEMTSASETKSPKSRRISSSEVVDADDISVATPKDISYYTSVILHSLCCNLKKEKGNHGFQLYDDVSLNFFKIFNSIPTEIKGTVSTFIDCKKLVASALHKYDIYENTKSDSAQAKEFLETADQLSHQLEVKENFGTRTFLQDDSLNPNRNRYRLLWQSAYASIVAVIRQNKGVRQEWANLLDVARTNREREEYMRQHMKEGKFRKHATATTYMEPGTLTADDMMKFRNELKLKNQGKSKSHKKNTHHGASAVLY